MDDDSFKLEMLSRLDRIQALLSFLCGAAKASEERSKVAPATQQLVGAEKENRPAPERSLIQEEMQENYQLAVQRWKAGNVQRMLD